MSRGDAGAKIETAIAEALDVLPTHWVLVVATADGEIHSLTSPDMPLWQRKGLLEPRSTDAQGDVR